MGTTIKILVFQGEHPEILPNMCMFCAEPLTEDQYQKVVMRVAQGVARPVALPICQHDRIDYTLQADPQGPDARSAVITATAWLAFGVLGAALAHNMQQQEGGNQALFTIDGVHWKFAKELERLRNLSPHEYAKRMEKADKAFAEKIASYIDLEAEQKRLEKEQQQALDEETFALQGAAGRGKVSSEVAESSSAKFLIAALIVGAISLVLLTCIAGGVGYILYTQRSGGPQVADEKKTGDPPKEQRAKIKVIDGEQQTIKFLVPVGNVAVTKVYGYTDKTVFYDKAGAKLANADTLKLDEYCVILPTEDSKGLQWLKLTEPPP